MLTNLNDDFFKKIIILVIETLFIVQLFTVLSF